MDISKLLSSLFILSSSSIFESFAKSHTEVLPNYYKSTLNIFADGGISSLFAAKATLYLATILFVTIAVGKILKFFMKLPVVAGQIIGGVILGPSLLNINHFSIFQEPLKVIDQVSKKTYIIASTDMFLFFVLLVSLTLTVAHLLWIAGHETDIQDMAKVGMVSTLAGFLAALFPILMIFLTTYYLFGNEFNFASSIGIGVVFAATSVSIPVAMLVSQKKMYLRFSKATMGAAIIDDILAIILFSLFTVLLQSKILGDGCNCATFSGHNASISSSLIYMLFAFLIMLIAGRFIIKPVTMLLRHMHLSHLIPSFAIIMMLLYFSWAEMVGGLAGITGAYFAGLFHRTGDEKHGAEKVISPYVNVMLLPLFLGSVGMQANLSVLTTFDYGIVIVLLFMAIISKLIGCYLSTFIANFFRSKNVTKWSLLESYLFGSCMIARGEVGLVIATILRGAQIISAEQFVICIAVIVLTTIATPIMLTIGFNKMEELLKEKIEKKIITIKIGPFKNLSSRQIFTLLTTIDLPCPIKSVVQLSEAKRVLTLSNNLKVFLEPEEGLIIEGNEKQIKELLTWLKNALLEDFDLIPDAPPPTITEI